jgi:S1-C subfamily serine protease
MLRKSHLRWHLHHSSRCRGQRSTSSRQQRWRLAAINGQHKEEKDFTSSTGSNHVTHDSSSSSSTNSSGTIRRRALFAGSALVASILFSEMTTPPSVARAYDEEERRIGIFEKTSRSVVFIDTFVERRDSLTTNIMEVPLGSGSGFVWDKQGHIVTNYHVVRNARSAQIAILLSGADAKLAAAKSNSLPTAASTVLAVSTNSENSADVSLRQTFTATIVGVDPGKDIAVLKIEADPVFLFPIAVGSSANIKVGQQAMAIGNPFGTFFYCNYIPTMIGVCKLSLWLVQLRKGRILTHLCCVACFCLGGKGLDHTLTSGIISGTGREVRSPIGRPITNVLQTDAAINPG